MEDEQLIRMHVHSYYFSITTVHCLILPGSVVWKVTCCAGVAGSEGISPGARLGQAHAAPFDRTAETGRQLSGPARERH